MVQKDPDTTTAFTPTVISLGGLPGRTPITVGSQASVREALQAMDKWRVGSIVVMDASTKRPCGILTLQDVLRRVALPGADISQPVTTIMTQQVETLQETASLYEGLLFMSHRRIRHVPVVNQQGELVRVVSLNQLRDPFGGAVDVAMNRIEEASDIDQLANHAREARSLGIELLHKHGDSGMLTSVLTALNDALSRKIIELVVSQLGNPPVPWCWIVMGSEGRFEQTFHTDQDNGLIFRANSAEEAIELRQFFLPMAKMANDYLDRCGIPHCTGGIMAGNPECCLSLDEWKQRFFGWIRTPDAQALLNATIYFDYRPLYGDDSLASELKDYLVKLAADQTTFLRFLANNALMAAPPIGVLRDFLTDATEGKKKTIDMKKFGARIFVDAARIFALSCGVSETNTISRLRVAGPGNGLHSNDINSAVQGFTQLQRIRMTNQALTSGKETGNLLEPAKLNRLDRKILHESLRQAQNLQSRLRQIYTI
jgi:CBS domain-containing protein